MKRLAFKPGIIVLLLCTLLSAKGASTTISEDYFGILRSGDVRKLRQALDKGASANARDAAGNTPLMHAAVYGDVSCVRLLLDRGADVNAANASGATALMRASFNYEKVRLLLDRGANVNARSAFGNTALILAARPVNSYRTVELLISRGADARATNFFGATPLMAAVAGGDEKSARLLMKHGANVQAQPTPDEPGFVFGGGRSALAWAAFRGDVRMMKLLMDAGASPNEMGGLGTPLAQAAWADQTAAAQLLLERGARTDMAGPRDGFSPLHWAASTENRDASLVKLLLAHKADPNMGGGDPVDAYLDVDQTPLMVARRRGNASVLSALSAAGATRATADPVVTKTPPARRLPQQLDEETTRAAIQLAIAPLQKTSLESKKSFVAHESKQNCTSCHQQYLPMAAIGMARKRSVKVDLEAERQLVKIVAEGELQTPEMDWQPLFHPDAAHTKGYELLGLAGQELAPSAVSDAWVHHLAAIQGIDGQWHNNLPRPPMQTSDVGATALGIHALQKYGMPGRKAEFAKQVDRARQWLWKAKPQNNEERIYQLLGLAWAGEPSRKLQPLAKALLAEQRSDGGWAQLPGLSTDAYATAQAVYALRVGAGLKSTQIGVERGLRYLLQTQLADGTWHVRRRAFPFQPTMNSGFPHGRDSWISAAATSWAVMALSVPENPDSSLVMAAKLQ